MRSLVVWAVTDSPGIMCAVFLRFVTTRTDGNSHRPQGVLIASHSLLDSGDLSSDEWQRMREIMDWFTAHLPSPKSFVTGRAIFWFKSTATESISKIWELVYMLRQHSYHIEVHRCRRLENIVYEDRFQVAAYPSKFDGRVTIH
jgi:protein gp37